MAKLCFALMLLAEISLGVVCGLEWETVPDEFVFACAGSHVTLPWRYKVTETERVVTVHWIHDGAFSSDMVATEAHGSFMATDGYLARVQHVANGGLVIRNLLADDSGNYTLEVNVDKQGMFHSHRQSVYLQVGDGLMIEGGQLTAEQEPEARWDQSSHQWRINLACGPFTYTGPPPLDVDWITPEGETRPSSGYDEISNRFHLTLPTPVRGGNYTCTIPPVRSPDLCYQQHGHRQAVLTASVSVDETKAMLSVLEANQHTLRQENKNMKARLLSLESGRVQQAENVTEYCEEMKKALEEQLKDLQTVQQTLQDKVEDLAKVGQEVPLTGPCIKGNHKTIDNPQRSTSVKLVGASLCDRNLEPGWYRFFLNGTNAVIPTSCPPTSRCHTNAPQWLNLQGQSLPNPGQETVARACAHWRGECCNWESPITVRNCGLYFVYKLKPRANCNLSFCAEPQQ